MTKVGTVVGLKSVVKNLRQVTRSTTTYALIVVSKIYFFSNECPRSDVWGSFCYFTISVLRLNREFKGLGHGKKKKTDETEVVSASIYGFTIGVNFYLISINF